MSTVLGLTRLFDAVYRGKMKVVFKEFTLAIEKGDKRRGSGASSGIGA